MSARWKHVGRKQSESYTRQQLPQNWEKMDYGALEHIRPSRFSLLLMDLSVSWWICALTYLKLPTKKLVPIWQRLTPDNFNLIVFPYIHPIFPPKSHNWWTAWDRNLVYSLKDAEYACFYLCSRRYIPLSASRNELFDKNWFFLISWSNFAPKMFKNQKFCKVTCNNTELKLF